MRLADWRALILSKGDFSIKPSRTTWRGSPEMVSLLFLLKGKQETTKRKSLL
jgi:hypothetical protein